MYMKNIEQIFEAIEEEIVNIDKAKDHVIPLIREGIKASGKAIEAMHNRDFEKAEIHLESTRGALKQTRLLLQPYPRLYYGPMLMDLEQEYAEAMLLDAILHERPLPTPAELSINNFAYLLGIADLVGELRRNALQCLLLGEEEKAERILSHMETVFSALTAPIFPKNLTHGFRHKIDVDRSLLERTRADVIVAVHRDRLRKALMEHGKNFITREGSGGQ
jgi:translin